MPLTYHPSPNPLTPRAGILLVPGGGYGWVSIAREGRAPSLWLNALGFDTWILEYTTVSEPTTTAPIYPKPLEDGLAALKEIRKLGTVDKLGIWGSSAGGHLAACLATGWRKEDEQEEQEEGVEHGVEHAGATEDLDFGRENTGIDQDGRRNTETNVNRQGPDKQQIKGARSKGGATPSIPANSLPAKPTTSKVFPGSSATGSTELPLRVKPDPLVDFAILAYPVITLHFPNTHSGSRHNLLGSQPSPALLDRLSAHRRVDGDTPPTFLFHTANDQPVPVANSLLFAQAMAENKRPFELLILPDGPHGVGMGDDEVARGTRTREWIGVLGRWLQDIMGKDLNLGRDLLRSEELNIRSDETTNNNLTGGIRTRQTGRRTEFSRGSDRDSASCSGSGSGSDTSDSDPEDEEVEDGVAQRGWPDKSTNGGNKGENRNKGLARVKG